MMVVESSWAEPTRRLVNSFIDEPSASARVLLTTIFGDVILPRARPVAVQSLAGLVEPLGINERSVRTSLQRLADERLVVGERIGRRSFYQVHDEARATFESAEGRIYHQRPEPWDGLWTLAVIDRADGDDAAARLGRELRWLGMGLVGSDVYVSATLDASEVAETAARLGAPLAVLTRAPLQAGTVGDDARLATLADPDGVLHDLHKWHLDSFRDLVPIAGALSPLEAFLARTLLITSWRRIALRSTDPPSELRPAGWLGVEAYELTGALYHRLFAPSEIHLDDALGAAAHEPPTCRFPAA